jgi:hypothetical protein
MCANIGNFKRIGEIAMSRIKSKKFSFDDVSVPADGVVSFNVYYKKDAPVDVDSPFVNVLKAGDGQTYVVDIPATVPVGEGTYHIGVCSVDMAGNESDIPELTGFFDWTAPPAPTNLRII